MEAVVHLDTHVVVWLAAGDVTRLKPAKSWIDSHELVISPMVRLELAFLSEIGRLRETPEKIIADLVDRVGLRVSGLSFSDAVSGAVHVGSVFRGSRFLMLSPALSTWAGREIRSIA